MKICIMCMMLYVGSNEELPIVSWDDKKPGFFLMEPKCSTDIVRNYLGTKNIYFASAYTGCGCGFLYGYCDCQEKEDKIAARKSVKNLFEYLKENSMCGIKLYSCWASKEGDGINFRTIIKINDFIVPDRFSFRENELIEIVFK